MKVLIIIPAYNEVAAIRGVIREALATGHDIVVVDDCSPDATGEVARAEGVRVLPLPVNLGIGGAVQTGFKFGVAEDYDVVVQLDGDGQHDAGEIEKILAPIAEGRADMVVGSRFVDKAEYKAPFARRVGMVLFSAIAGAAMGERIYDTTSGFRAINRPVLRFLSRNYPVDFPDAETLVLVRRAGFRIVEVPVKMRPRASGHSSTTSLKSIYYPFKQLLSVIVVLLRKKPAVAASDDPDTRKEKVR